MPNENVLSHDSRVIRSRRVVLPSGVRPASIAIREGIISSVGPYDAPVEEDFGEVVIMPGLVDTHVHINEPGRTDWEGFATATQAAGAGGMTTLIDMPLNSRPPTVSAEALETKWAAAEGRCWVDTGFWGGVIPGNSREIRPLWEVGCFGFKCFLAPSGVDEFPNVTEADLREAMPEIAACGSILLAHAEDPAYLRSPSGDGRHYANYLASRPRQAEDAAIGLLIRLSRETGCRVHIVHLSSSDSLAQLAAARATGVPITVETCPHYLFLAALAGVSPSILSDDISRWRGRTSLFRRTAGAGLRAADRSTITLSSRLARSSEPLRFTRTARELR